MVWSWKRIHPTSLCAEPSRASQLVRTPLGTVRALHRCAFGLPSHKIESTVRVTVQQVDLFACQRLRKCTQILRHVAPLATALSIAPIALALAIRIYRPPQPPTRVEIKPLLCMNLARTLQRCRLHRGRRTRRRKRQRVWRERGNIQSASGLFRRPRKQALHIRVVNMVHMMRGTHDIQRPT